MTPTDVDTPEMAAGPTVQDRVLDATRQAAHISHEAQRLKSLAADAVEDGVHAVKRAVKSVTRGMEELGDLKDEAAQCVKRQPLGRRHRGRRGFRPGHRRPLDRRPIWKTETHL